MKLNFTAMPKLSEAISACREQRVRKRDMRAALDAASFPCRGKDFIFTPVQLPEATQIVQKFISRKE